MSLYLKYRPQDFKTIVGQDHIVTSIANAIKHDSFAHAYLFCGPRGTGKTSLARIIAKSLNCLNRESNVDPCNACNNCKAILDSHLVDLIEIDAASNRGIDEIRELREKILFAPSQGKAKVYIIDEVHMLTKEAFNALLKTLEEPPAHAFFVLATTEAHKIPETIVSRCQQFNFKRIALEHIQNRLLEIAKSEKVQAEPDAIALIARKSNGGLRDAIGLFEQMIIDGAVIYQEVLDHLGVAGHQNLERLSQAIENKNPLNALELVEQLNNQGHSLNQFCAEYISHLREQMLIGLSAGRDVNEVIRWIELFTTAKEQINQATIPLLPIEIAIIKACQYQSGQMPESNDKAEQEVDSRGVEIAEDPLRPTAQTTDMSLELIQKEWRRVIDQIETPYIRMSLSDGELTDLRGSELFLAFSSKTLMEKVANPKNQVEIIKAIESVYQVKLSLVLEMKKISLKPVEKKDDTRKESSVADMAKEVFGA